MDCGGQLPLDSNVWSSFTDLTTLNMTNNNCDGYVPQYLFDATNITTMDMGGNNQFSGPVPYRNMSATTIMQPSQAPVAGSPSPACCPSGS